MIFRWNGCAETSSKYWQLNPFCRLKGSGYSAIGANAPMTSPFIHYFYLTISTRIEVCSDSRLVFIPLTQRDMSIISETSDPDPLTSCRTRGHQLLKTLWYPDLLWIALADSFGKQDDIQIPFLLSLYHCRKFSSWLSQRRSVAISVCLDARWLSELDATHGSFFHSKE